MAVKSIIDIEVNDAAFKAFKALFDKHKKELDKLPGVWNETNDAIDGTVDKADSLLHAIEKQTNILNKQLITQIKISEEMKKTDRNMVSIGSNSGKALKNIQGITFSMLKWGAITGAFTATLGLLSGATGFFGLDALARGASQTRQQAGALGLNPNELQAVQTVYRRFGGSTSALGAISSAQIEAGKQWPLRQLGISQEDIEGKSSAQLMPLVMSALQREAQQALKDNPQSFSYIAQGRGWTQVMSLPELRELAGRPTEELEAANQSLPRTLERLTLGKGSVSKWDDFLQSLETATNQLNNTFIEGLQKLAQPLGHVVDAFTKLANKIFSDPAFAKGIDSFAEWIENFARNMDSPEFKESVDKFVGYAVKLTTAFVSVIEWLLGETPKEPVEGIKPGDNILMPGGVRPDQLWNPNYKKPAAYYTPSSRNPVVYSDIPAGAQIVGASNDNVSSAKHFAYGEQYLEAKRPGAFGALERQYGLPAGLLAQIHKQEWDPRQPVSSAGAMGPFQFMPGTAKDYGLDEKSVWDLAKSSEAAARYFQDLLVMFKGDVNKAAAGYNWGQENVKKTIDRYGDNWREHLSPETEKYLNNLNRSGLGVNSFTAQPGQGVKISLYNATGGQVNAVISSLAA